MAKYEAPPTGPADEPPAHEPPATTEPPAATTAKEEGEKVPEWGKTLMSQVESLTAAVTAVVPPTVEGPNIDENPSPKPWHRKGGK